MPFLKTSAVMIIIIISSIIIFDGYFLSNTWFSFSHF